jgi:hypothetical protein
MSKGKRITRGDKEVNELQRAKYEISKLKKTVSSLRKQLARNTQNYENVKDLIDQQHSEEKFTSKSKEVDLKKKYSCWECGSGYLRIVLLPIRGKVTYFRRCSNHPNCKNRTDKKPYDPDTVKGIMEHSDEEIIENAEVFKNEIEKK